MLELLFMTSDKRRWYEYMLISIPSRCTVYIEVFESFLVYGSSLVHRKFYNVFTNIFSEYIVE